LALFNLLQYPLALFPRVIHNTVVARTAVQRIQRFLQGEEIRMLAVQAAQPAVTPLTFITTASALIFLCCASFIL
jgi:hypothetical protein